MNDVEATMRSGQCTAIAGLNSALLESGHSASRDSALDIFKSLLVIGMICGHAVQLAVLKPSKVERAFSFGINLLTFSGFMFAYGAGVGLSKHGRTSHLWKTLRRVLEIYVAYLLSTLAFIIIDKFAWPTPLQLVQIATMARLFGFSEFLASFVVLAAVVTFLRPELKAWSARPAFLLSAVIIGILSTFLTYSGSYLPLLPTLLGNNSFPNFPLIPYSIWFFAGLVFVLRKQNIDTATAGLAIIGTLLMMAWVIAFKTVPSRFPPNYIWIVGASLPISIYLLAARRLASVPRIARWLALPGKQTLSLLVGSNIIFFALDRRGKFDIEITAVILMVIAVIGSLMLLRYMISKIL